jgi:hypothetical protein
MARVDNAYGDGGTPSAVRARRKSSREP